MALLVKTKSGIGVVVGETAGKLMVEIVNDDMSLKEVNGKPVKMLVHKVAAIPMGFVTGYKAGRQIDELEKLQDFVGQNNDLNIEIPDDNEQYDYTTGCDDPADDD